MKNPVDAVTEPVALPGPQTRNGSLSALLSSAVDGIIVIRDTGIIQTVSDSAERLFGYDRADLIAQNVKVLMNDDHRPKHNSYLQNYITTGEAKIIGTGRELTARRKDGSDFDMHLTVGEFEEDGATFFTGIIHDLTQRNETERALREVQKIEAMGQMTGGVAHDFNNLLAIIMGNIDLLMMKADLGPNLVLAQEAMKAAELGASLTTRLLAFARRSPLVPQKVQLNDLITSLMPLLQRTMGDDISVTAVLDPSAWQVKVDPAQFQTALVNLAVNACDAMPHGGRLVVETRNFEVDRFTITEGLAHGMNPGQYVRVAITDTGHGMSQAIINQVFEPFFTTKPEGKGTGLGLSMVYGFTKQSGGEVTIYSEPGKGTTINLHVPRDLDDEAAVIPAIGSDIRTTMTGGVILVVEDNDQVRRLTRNRLEVLGYTVLEAINGPAAVAVLNPRGRHIDLVFTDLVMPGGMSGYDVARHVQDNHPETRVLLTSGYAEELINGDKLSTSQLKLLRKPYSQAALSQALGQAFDSLRDGAGSVHRLGNP